MRFNITEEAFKELENRYMNPERAFRIMINGFGWGGPVFGVVLDEQLEGDYLEEINGIKYVANEDIVEQFGSFKVHFASNMFRKGFVVTTEHGGSNC